MWSLCRTHVQAISRRVFGADDFAEATGPTHTPPLSLDPDKPTRILATYRHPRPQDGWAAAGGLLDKVVVVVSVLMPLIQALYNFVDVVLDVVVARQLGSYFDLSLLCAQIILHGQAAVGRVLADPAAGAREYM